MANTSMSLMPKAVLRGGLGVPFIVLALLAMMILPIPPFLLDLVFTFNISLSLVILLASVYSRRPLDLAVFPSILLVATLLRLALNIASTRVVLLNGSTGTDAAGKVVQSFGEVVIGGNYAVGLVVFSILVIINFIVVTKGGGRISEVSARFTLDAMPGKQMAIDADLNAGLISQEEAKVLRDDVRNEADFYGSMDGASKFVRGDAVAGLLILFINLIGGLCIGVFQHSMSFSDAAHNYALLTIGDGLVAQIPSLLLSTAAAIMVTRVSSDADMGGQIVSQLFANKKTLMITSMVMAVIGVIPGMPHFAFLLLAAISGAGAYFYQHREEEPQTELTKREEAEAKAKEEAEEEQNREVSWDDITAIDTLGLEIGYRLVSLVDEKEGGKLMERVKSIRKKVSQDLGFLVAPVRIRDNLDLEPNVYRVIVMGVTVAQVEIHVDKLMAIDPGKTFGKLEGIPTKDPAFGLSALWIDHHQKEQAQSLGYTIVDPSTVIATHLSQLMRDHSPDLLGFPEMETLVERLREVAPKLVDELIPDPLPLSSLVKVAQNLLREGVPITDLRTIIETLADHAPRSRDIDTLVSASRIALSRTIIQNINGLSEEVPVITLTPELEQILQNALQAGGESGASFEPGLIDKLQGSLSEMAQRQEVSEEPAILLVSPGLRTILSRFVRCSVPNLHVLSYPEIPDNKQLKVIGSVGQ